MHFSVVTLPVQGTRMRYPNSKLVECLQGSMGVKLGLLL
jgi:hypothetical protein